MRAALRWRSCRIVLLLLASGTLTWPGAAAGQERTAADATRLVLDADSRKAWVGVFSPDGKTLASGGDDGIVKFWDAATGRAKSASEPSKDHIRHAAFSPDGKTLATGHFTGAVKLWSSASGKVSRSPKPEHTEPISALVFSPDGRLLVSCGLDRKIMVWETTTWTPLRGLVDLPQTILSASISPDSSLLAISMGDPGPKGGGGAVWLYDLATLDVRLELPGLQNTMWAVAFAPDGKTLATGSGRFLQFWDPATGAPRARFAVNHNIRILDFSRDGKQLLVAGSGITGDPPQGTGTIWDMAAQRPQGMFLGHGNLVLCGSFSPDGRLVVTAGIAPEVKVWEVAKLPAVEGPVVRSAVPPRNRNAPGPGPSAPFVERPLGSSAQVPEILGFAWSGDASRVVTGHESELRIWDRATARVLARQDLGGKRAASVAFSPDGLWIASVERLGEESQLVIRDGATGKAGGTLPGANPGVTGAVFAPDGRAFVTTNRWKNVRLWDTDSLTAKLTLGGHDSEITWASFTPDGKRFATSSLDGTARIWDAGTGAALATLADHSEGVQRVAFAPDGKTLATASFDGTIKLWNAADGRALATLTVPDAAVLAVAFSPDGKQLATAASRWGPRYRYAPAASEVRLWDVATRQTTAVLPGHENHVFTLLYLPDGKTLASYGLEHIIRLWDVATSKLAGRFPPAPQNKPGEAPETEELILALAYSPDGRVLAQAGEDKTVSLRDATTGDVLKTLTGHADIVSGLAFAPDGQTLASASYDKTVRLWDVAAGTEKAVLQGHKNWILAVAFASDGKTLASASYDKTVRLWDVAAARESAVLTGHSASVRAVAFAPDGNTVASAGSDRVVKLWDVARRSARATLKGHTKPIRVLAFSPDGTLLASGSEDAAIKLWDPATGAERSTLAGHADMITCLTFARGGSQLVSACWDGVIKLWDVGAAKEEATFRAHAEAVAALALAPDGQQLATSGYDKRLKLWKAGR